MPKKVPKTPARAKATPTPAKAKGARSPGQRADLTPLEEAEALRRLQELDPARYATGKLAALLGKDRRHVPLTQAEAQAIWDETERRREARAAKLPDERSAIDAMFEAWVRLKELGWREAEDCPKDGSSFEVIEPGSTGIFRCHYHDEWPKGTWWVEDGGDLCPSRPILFRLYPEDEAKRKAKMQAARARYAAERIGMTAEPLIMFVITHDAMDLPNRYACRPFTIGDGMVQPEPIACVSTSLDALRAPFQGSGLYRQPRHPADEPHIVEVWF